MYSSESSLDTNLLVRFYANDTPAQREKVQKLLTENCAFYICDVVATEIVHVLSKTYNEPRDNIRDFFNDLQKIPNIFFESSFLLEVLEFWAAHPALSFVDCYAATFAEKNNKEPLLTFDKKLSNQHLSAKLLS